ncbi:MAG TPA: 50S ribosomal protein L15 [Candidatus Veblenbacteria bacterium]|uniref:Large ribosomal subunit protein uL15 n=2 Tax=Candidatus Vebleniibacteriota TaxID=1817921 RepID=A0A1G2QAG9_9BACT|nr:MAG: 50S ribosomal protein L15 [Parcubacteria group bacterium GW2011_GWE2_43_12]KKT13425.1 MAG: 50S ribosomal protein L15 [Parcubacteria group bacterium GW2011_GWA1_43_27]KKT27907.1 MAG: 50S ribosomal protein L15 [Parcubacteria group bacterium GW2011_GWF1_43_9]OHA54680.1 MAG: 50S ribosomal protein L15 [Candidatus Veblenbacteria bacterium RIFOXYB1_FULL_43_13]OHA57567.1 MAG: 50S ribosomal protein L15 [Candidatus Veblenbacteria bacterium RIFOXYD1_FULL_43_11]HAO81290.1 50S ribosomal protein L15
MSLELHNLKSSPGSRRAKKRLGRGNASGHGTTATRGTKGQRARQGGRKGLIQFGVKHFVSHLPKVRGFQSFKAQPQVVSLISLEKISQGTTITPELLFDQGLIASATFPVKLIGRSSKLPAKLIVKVQAVSAGAKASLEVAGAKVELIPASNKGSKRS